MKIKRQKKLSKHLNFYVVNFRFRQPYQVLVDGTFCLTALQNKINIADNLPKYLQGEIKFLTTPCVCIETEKLGHKVAGAVHILKQFSVHQCGHKNKPITGSHCLLSMIGKFNENHYIVATQDRDLQDQVRLRPGAPLIYLHQKTPVFENPSEASIKYANDQNHLGAVDKERIAKLKVESGIPVQQEAPKKKKKKKGPNPLSCLKKKKKQNVDQNNTKSGVSSGGVEKVKRKRIKIPKHVKEELLKNASE